MDVQNMMPPSSNRLEANLTLHNLVIREIAFKDPPVCFFVSVFGQLLLDLKPVIKLYQLNQIEMSFRNEVLKVYW